jgi:microcystin-dependent protein
MANSESISWRNAANTGNLPLTVNASDQLEYNGTPITSATGFVTSVIGTTHQIIASSPVGGVTLSTPQDIDTTSDVTFNSLTLAGLTASQLVVTDSSKKLNSLASPSLTEVGYLTGVTSAVQTQLPNKAPLNNPTFTGTVTVPNAVNPTDAVAFGQLGTAAFQPGDLKAAAYSTVPTGWLLCDGASYLRATYSALFAAIGTNYGSIDGTHFNVPNFVDNVPVGVGGSITPSLGSTAGSATHTLTNAEVPATGVTVSISDPGHHHSYTTKQDLAYPGNQVTAFNSGSTNSSTGTSTTGISASGTVNGGGGAHSIVQPSLGINWFIKI